MTRHGDRGLHGVEFFFRQQCSQLFGAQGKRPRLRPLRWTCILLRSLRRRLEREAYNGLKAEWLQNGGQLSTAPHEATVAEVVVAYTEFATGYYVVPKDCVKKQAPHDHVALLMRVCAVVGCVSLLV